MRFELYQEPTGTYYYRLVGDFFRYVLMGELYTKKENAIRDIETAKTNISEKTNIDYKTTDSGEHYFEVKNKEGRVVGSSCLFKTIQAMNEKLDYITPKIRKTTLMEKQLYTPL